MNEMNLLCSIVEYGFGSKVITGLKPFSLFGTTVILGKGTIHNKFMKLLGIHETRKEICLSLVMNDQEDEIYEKLENKLKLEKKGHGILFSIPLMNKENKSDVEIDSTQIKETKSMSNKEAIFVIVDHGKAHEVIDFANEAGAKGGTIIHGRGSNIDEKAKLFNMNIEPEKDIVLILAHKDKVEKITDSIKVGMNIEDDYQGIIFVVDVSRTTGLYTN